MLVAFALAAACLATFGVAQSGRAHTRPVVPVALSCARPGGTLVAYGHSYLLSPRIGGATTSYVSLAAASLGAKSMIRAVNRGDTADIERLVRRGPSRWVPGSAKLVLIDSGINDIARRVPTAQWTASLRRTLAAFAVRPVPTILLVRPLPVARAGHPGRDARAVSNYAAAQRSVASAFSAVRIVDASSGWDPRTDLSRDGVHPNAAGMQHIARAVQGSAQRSCRA
jgi:lysophospholipase L1-like esterase